MTWARPPKVRSTLPPRSWSWPTSCWGAPSFSMWAGRGTRWGGTRWTSSPPPDWADWDTVSPTEVRRTQVIIESLCLDNLNHYFIHSSLTRTRDMIITDWIIYSLTPRPQSHLWFLLPGQQGIFLWSITEELWCHSGTVQKWQASSSSRG